jgi:hypothetical protein
VEDWRFETSFADNGDEEKAVGVENENKNENGEAQGTDAITQLSRTVERMAREAERNAYDGYVQAALYPCP